MEGLHTQGLNAYYVYGDKKLLVKPLMGKDVVAIFLRKGAIDASSGDQQYQVLLVKPDAANLTKSAIDTSIANPPQPKVELPLLSGKILPNGGLLD